MAMDESVKKIINNSVFIAELAPLIEGQEASDLAAAARAYSNILSKFKVEVSTDGFDGCKQAQRLVGWWKGDGKPDTALILKWTGEIKAAVADLANGKIPKA